MGMQTSGSTARQTRTANLPAMANFSIAGIYQMTSTFNNGQNIWSIFDTNTTKSLYLQTDGAGSQLFLNLNGNGTDSKALLTMVVGDWFYLACTIDGTAVKFYVANTLSSGLRVITSTATGAWWTPTTMYLAQRPDTFGRFNGRYGYTHMWSRTLTPAQVEAQRWQIAPVEQNNLNGQYDFVPGSLRYDKSGNGNNWTQAASGVTDFAAPPVPYRREVFAPVIAPVTFVPVRQLANMRPNNPGGF